MDGTGMQKLFAGEETLDDPCCGSWTPDGRYYVFEASARGGPPRSRDIWAVRESRFEGTQHPVALTQGPLRYLSPLIARNGTRVYAIGRLDRGELVRYDARVNSFAPWLGGPSIEHVVFAAGNTNMAFTSYPDWTLWRSRPDGSERVQLTFPPLRVALPHWSPDGRQIAFAGLLPKGEWQIYVVSADGGQPRVLLPEVAGAIDPDWSLDGKTILYGPQPLGGHITGIHLYDLGTGRDVTLPDSNQLMYPHWSPSRRYIAASTRALRGLMLYDFTTQTWTKLVESNVNYPTWTADEKYLYFDTISGKEPAIVRVAIPSRKLERVASLKEMRRPTGAMGLWSGLTPDGSPLTIRNIGTQEICMFEVRFP